MNKMMSIVLMVTGIVFMVIISVLYSFSTMNISTGVYMTLWCICIVMVRVAANLNCGWENLKQSILER